MPSSVAATLPIAELPVAWITVSYCATLGGRKQAAPTSGKSSGTTTREAYFVAIVLTDSHERGAPSTVVGQTALTRCVAEKGDAHRPGLCLAQRSRQKYLAKARARTVLVEGVPRPLSPGNASDAKLGQLPC